MLYTCTRCKEEKLETEFYVRKGRPNGKGRLSECKECTKKRTSKRYKKDPDLINDKRAAKLYGLSLQEVVQMRKDANGICAVCNREGLHHHKRLVIDHDHETGAVRGLICSRCNSAIGFLGDNIDNVENLLLYLKKHKHKHKNK